MSNNAKVILMRGIQGSGKTTRAKELVTHSGLVRISRDDIRQQLFGSLHGGNIDEDLVTDVETGMAKAVLRTGKSVVIDATHLYQKYINRWQRLGYPVEIEEVTAPLEVLLAQNDLRDNPVPASVIRRNFSKFATTKAGDLKPVKLTPEHFVTSIFPKYVPDIWKDSAYIFDIDGTLAHMDGKRSPYDYSKVMGDRVDDTVREVLNQLQGTHQVILVSGRKHECREETLEWLNNHFIYPDKLFMRADGDDRPDSVVKYEILMNKIAPHFSVEGVFDDRNSVVEMWRNIGLKCFQVEYCDF